MHIIRGASVSFVPSAHEDPQNPGVFKKVLLSSKDELNGKIEMVNWARLPKGKSFQAHYHEDMDEVFILLTGELAISVDAEKEILKKGDAVIVRQKQIHVMTNNSNQDVEYIVFGISKGKNGKTVIVQN